MLSDFEHPMGCGCGCLSDAQRDDAKGPAAAPELVDDHTAIISALDPSGSDSHRWNHADGALDMGTPVVVTYAFASGPELPAPGDMPYAVDSVYGFTGAQQESFRLATEMIEAVCGVTFVEVEDTDLAQIDVMAVTGAAYGGWADYPGTGEGQLVINGIGSFAPGSFDFLTIMHELGHALGLEHPFGGTLRLDPSLDDTGNTVMSYDTPGFAYPTELGALDVAALQEIYGMPDTGLDVAEGARGVSVTGTTGHDDIVVGASDDDVRSGTGDDVIWLDAGDDEARGGAGDDVIYGGSGKDRIFGSDGDDTIWGGQTTDRLNGGEGADVLHGEGGKDKLTGHYGDDVLYGGIGDDTLRDRGANDRAYGGDGDDLIYIEGGLAEGGAGDDNINHTGAHDLTLAGGAGADYLFGSRSGTDRYTFTEEDVGWLDIVYRFEAERDVIVIDGDWDASDREVTQTGSNVLVTHGDLEFRMHGLRAEDAGDWEFVYI